LTLLFYKTKEYNQLVEQLEEVNKNCSLCVRNSLVWQILITSMQRFPIHQV